MQLKTLFLPWLLLGAINAYGAVGAADKSSEPSLISAKTNSPGLTQLASYTGRYGVSTDGFGSTSQSGTISALIPSGSTIVKAYLYSAGYGFDDLTGSNIDIDGLKFNGVTVSFDKYYVNEWGYGAFKTGRVDVTDMVQAAYDGTAAGGIYNFTVLENDAAVDGEALVVVYENSTLPVNTISIIEGGANIYGDSFVLNYDEPLDPSAEGFSLEMSLGISFSAEYQASTVKVNDQIITENAGDNDDGELANGALITVGGFDDPYSAHLPSYSGDHERYDLSSYVSYGDTSLKIDTINPSQDDNLFLVVFKSYGSVQVDVTCDLNSAYDDGFEAGKAYCEANPSNCNISPRAVVIPF